MKCVTKRTITRTISGTKLHIDDVIIGENKHSLNIINPNRSLGSPDNRPLILNFMNPEDADDDTADYTIVMDKRGIRFERFVYRPNHDHNNVESLQVVVDPKKANMPLGERVWMSRAPYLGGGFDYFYIDFGSTKVNY